VEVVVIGIVQALEV